MLELVNISKVFEKFSVRNLSLFINRGDYLTILGVSGAGKTMLLELISGIIKPDEGIIRLNNIDITKSPIQSRNFGIVYQDQSLFPHMKVFENIAYPLKCKKTKKSIIQKAVIEIARETEISHLLDRPVNNLSGGESQRVAIARALVANPEILLLDEPLSFLDVNLKHDITALLRKINRKGQTVIHVTHNYKEAILLSNKVGIIENGVLIQHGQTNEVFKYPKSKFVANFLGTKNYFPGNIIEVDEKKYFISNNIKILVPIDSPLGICNAWIRNNNIFVIDEKNKNGFENIFKCKILEIEPTSKGVEIYTDIGLPIYLYVSSNLFDSETFKVGMDIVIGFRPEDICTSR